MILELNSNWEVEVNDRANRTSVYMFHGGRAIMVHLHNDGTSSVDVSSHDCNDKHASVSKKTTKYKVSSGSFTCKTTELTSHDTKVELKKFTRM